MSKWLTDEEFQFIYQNVPRICVDLIVKHEGKILLTKRTGEPHLHKWHIPGGAIKFKESIHDAIHRLAKGELDIDVTRYEFVDVMEFPNEKRNGGDYHSISLGYIIQTEGKPSDGEWFSDFPEFTIPQHLTFLKANFSK